MEGKKYRALDWDCQAVSEMMGVVLMISIVVLAFSSIAITVFSDGGSMNPPHTPHTNLRENINASKNTLEIFHNGGETIDLKYIKIILDVNGQQAEFNMSDSAVKVFDPEGNQLPSDGVFALGDYIVIDPSGKINIEHGDVVDFYFVHTESSQVIQKTKLWTDGKEFPDWITPHTFPGGTAYDNYKKKPLETELVDKVKDDKFTSTHIPQNEMTYENFTFAIDTKELEIPEDTLFTNITLRIVCTRHDQSRITITPEINNGSSQWIQLPAIDFTKSMALVDQNYTITEYVKTATEIENLEVRILAEGHAGDSADKSLYVDFVGVHLEF